MEHGNSRLYAIIIIIFTVLVNAFLTLQLKVIYINRELKNELFDNEIFNYNLNVLDQLLYEHTNIDSSLNVMKTEYYTNVSEALDKVLEGNTDLKFAFVTSDTSNGMIELLNNKYINEVCDYKVNNKEMYDIYKSSCKKNIVLVQTTKDEVKNIQEELKEDGFFVLQYQE